MSTTSATTTGRPTTSDGFEVLDQCHRDTLGALDVLHALLTRLEAEGDSEGVRTMANAVVQFFANRARTHHEDEERHIFPEALAGGDPEIVETVLRLQQDHIWLEEDWLELSPHLSALAAGRSWWDVDFLREAIAVFSALSRDHIALEESCIYPQARARLKDLQRQNMGREMAARRRAQRAARHRTTNG